MQETNSHHILCSRCSYTHANNLIPVYPSLFILQCYVCVVWTWIQLWHKKFLVCQMWTVKYIDRMNYFWGGNKSGGVNVNYNYLGEIYQCHACPWWRRRQLILSSELTIDEPCAPFHCTKSNWWRWKCRNQISGWTIPLYDLCTWEYSACSFINRQPGTHNVRISHDKTSS